MCPLSEVIIIEVHHCMHFFSISGFDERCTYIYLDNDT